MAKNVVLKDADGNELNVNLYNHKLFITSPDEKYLTISITNTSNTSL